MSNYQMGETHLHSSTLPLKVIPDTSFLSVSGCGHLNDMSAISLQHWNIWALVGSCLGED